MNPAVTIDAEKLRGVALDGYVLLALGFDVTVCGDDCVVHTGGRVVGVIGNPAEFPGRISPTQDPALAQDILASHDVETEFADPGWVARCHGIVAHGDSETEAGLRAVVRAARQLQPGTLVEHPAPRVELVCLRGSLARCAPWQHDIETAWVNDTPAPLSP